MATSSAENEPGGAGDGKPNRSQRCHVATKIQSSPTQRQREGTHQMGAGVHFNGAARYLEVLWKYAAFTQKITLGRKKGCIWVCAREMTHAKNV